MLWSAVLHWWHQLAGQLQSQGFESCVTWCELWPHSHILTCTQLKCTRSFLHIGTNDYQDGFCDCCHWDLTNTYWSHIRTLIEWYIRRHECECTQFMLTLVVVIQRPELASAVQRLLEAELKEEQSLLQACASNPEGPAAPWRAACIMASASKPIKYDGIDWFMLTIKEGMGAPDL